jgi:hypothetical protein
LYSQTTSTISPPGAYYWSSYVQVTVYISTQKTAAGWFKAWVPGFPNIREAYAPDAVMAYNQAVQATRDFLREWLAQYSTPPNFTKTAPQDETITISEALIELEEAAK